MNAIRVSNSNSVIRSQPSQSANSILNKITSPGAGDTARADGLAPGHASSVKMAMGDLPLIQKYKADIESVAKETGLPPALLAGIISRESRGGEALDAKGYGDHGNGYGLMQVDRRTAAGVGGPFSRENIKQGAEILKGKLGEIQKAHPDWTPEWQLRGAVAAYNFGASNVRTQAGMDSKTANDDYSADVWSRAQALAPSFPGSGGAAAASTPLSTPMQSNCWGELSKKDSMGAPSAQLGQKLGSMVDQAGAASPSAAQLSQGSKGEDVASLQKALNVAGVQPALDIDGDFGPKTEAALKEIQSKLGLASDGVFGSQTASKLMLGDSASSLNPATLGSLGAGAGKEIKPGQKGPEVAELKQALKDAGFYKGVINDTMGPDGVKALKAAKEQLKLGGAADVCGPFTMEKIKQAGQSSGSSSSGGATSGTTSGTAQVSMKPVAQVHGTDCGITSASMIINKLTGKNTTSPGLQANYGFNLIPALQGNGVKVTDHGDLHNQIGSEDKAFQTFQNALSKGHPVLFGANGDNQGTHWSGGAGHYMVATGVSVENGQRMLTFNDPNGGVERKVPFNHLWNAALRHDGNCVLECS